MTVLDPTRIPDCGKIKWLRLIEDNFPTVNKKIIIFIIIIHLHLKSSAATRALVEDEWRRLVKVAFWWEGMPLNRCRKWYILCIISKKNGRSFRNKSGSKREDYTATTFKTANIARKRKALGAYLTRNPKTLGLSIMESMNTTKWNR